MTARLGWRVGLVPDRRTVGLSSRPYGIRMIIRSGEGTRLGTEICCR